MTEKERLIAEMERMRVLLDLFNGATVKINHFPTYAPPEGFRLMDEPEDCAKN
jgi:hypothetical protein